MNKSPTLTLAYLSHAPQSAAQVLQQIDPAQAAAFLTQAPARLTAPVLSEMTPWSGARIIEGMSPPQAAALLGTLNFDSCLALIRLIKPEQQALLYDELPTRLARRLRSALNYPSGSVGAWIDPEVPAFPEQTRVSAVLDYLSRATPLSHVFVQSASDGRFLGALAVSGLITMDPARALAELPRLHVQALSSRATLASVAARHDWDSFLIMPVVGRSKALVGGLSRSSLRRGLNLYHDSGPGRDHSLLGELMSALTTSTAGLLQALAQGSLPGKKEKLDEQRR